MKAFSLVTLLLLLFIQSPVEAQDQQTARDKLKQMHVAFTNDAFIQSIVEDDMAKAELFLAAGMNPNSTYTGGELIVGGHLFSSSQTALLLALYLHHTDMASLLIEKGADVNQKGEDEAFPLMLAKGALVTELIGKGADVNQSGHYGQTALIYGVMEGDLEKIVLLLEHGADVNAKNQAGQSVLRMAASYRRPQIVKLLIEHGVDLSGFSERAIRLMTNEAQPGDEVTQLIGKLHYTRSSFAAIVPTVEAQQQVPVQLLEIADRSAESRARVIERLLDVVEDPTAQDEEPIAQAWMTAVEVLGKLKATEAIDALVEHLDRTGQSPLAASTDIRPTNSALANIGEPALPKLIQALSHPNPAIRMEAAMVLFNINKDKARAALESVCRTEQDKQVKGVFEDVIKRIEQK